MYDQRCVAFPFYDLNGDLPDDFRWRAVDLGNARHADEQVGVGQFDDRSFKGVTTEIVMHGPARDAGRLGDLADGASLPPVTGYQSFHCIDDAVGRLG